MKTSVLRAYLLLSIFLLPPLAFAAGKCESIFNSQEIEWTKVNWTLRPKPNDWEPIDPLRWKLKNYESHIGKMKSYQFENERPLFQIAWPVEKYNPVLRDICETLWKMSFEPERIQLDNSYEKKMVSFIKTVKDPWFNDTKVEMQGELARRQQIRRRLVAPAVETQALIVILKNGTYRVDYWSRNRMTDAGSFSEEQLITLLGQDANQIARILWYHTHPGWSVPLHHGDKSAGQSMKLRFKNLGVTAPLEMHAITMSKDQHLLSFGILLDP